jgi:hypothetical protein
MAVLRYRINPKVIRAAWGNPRRREGRTLISRLIAHTDRISKSLKRSSG